MLHRNIKRVALSIAYFLIPLCLFAQQPIDTTEISRPGSLKVGLALSGGGAKGFAHIGVLKVFEEEGIPVHMISGTSMGSIVGSLYAIGYSAQEIEDIVLNSDWSVIFNDNYRINPQNISNSVSSRDTYLFTFPFSGNRLRLPSGLIDGQNISMMLYRLMLPYHDVQDFTKLPIPFATVATDLSNGEAHTFTQGYLPDAVRASSAIPTIFKPVKINGKTYIDGGIARNIPVEDVRNLGADIVIASDVGEPIKPVDSLNTFVDVLFQSVGFHQKESDLKQQALTDFYLRPDIREFSSFSYERASAIIKRGEEAARELVPQIKAYMNNNNITTYNLKTLSTRRDTLLIADVSLTNISGLLEQQTNLTLDIQPPSQLTLSDIEQKINRLYSSGLFSQISYRLQNHSDFDGSQLVLEFQKKEQEYVGFSVRYDSHYKAALLFGASLTDNIFWSDRLTTRLRIGEVLELSSQYNTPLTLAPLSTANLDFSIQRSPINLYNQSQAFSTVQVEKLGIAPSLSVRLFDQINIEGGVEAEVYSLDEAVGNTLVLGNTNFLFKNFLQVDYNTLNRPYFPTRGQSLNLIAELSEEALGSSSSFFQFSGNWKNTIPLVKGVTFTSDFFTGYTFGSDIPLHYRYYLGGITQNPVFTMHQHPLAGYSNQQLSADNMLGIQADLQFRLGKETYLSGGWNAAHLSDQWTLNLDPGNMEYGYSLSLGALTIIGPIELSLSTPNLRNNYAVKIEVGYRF